VIQAPSKGTRPARLDMSNVLEEQKSQRTLFTEIDGLQCSINQPTFISQESDEKLVVDEDRLVSIFAWVFGSLFYQVISIFRNSFLIEKFNVQ